MTEVEQEISDRFERALEELERTRTYDFTRDGVHDEVSVPFQRVDANGYRPMPSTLDELDAKRRSRSAQVSRPRRTR